jgi:predicted HTH domain antitoxin
MRNIITEDEFKTTLQRNEKKTEKHREIHNVLTILLTTATDIILRFRTHLAQASPNEFSDDILKEINPIVDYVNECLRYTAMTYKSKVIQFTTDIKEV